MNRYLTGLLVLAALAIVWAAPSNAGGKLESKSKVKATAVASKIEGGKQTVTITLAVEKGWHIYANPVNHEFLAEAKTVVKVAAKGKLSEVRVMYPEGKTHTDKNEKYDIYDGTVKIPVSFKRAMGDTSPLEVSVIIQACDNSVCLQGSTIKLTVP